MTDAADKSKTNARTKDTKLFLLTTRHLGILKPLNPFSQQLANHEPYLNLTVDELAENVAYLNDLIKNTNN
jgi:hypothetical protein